MAATKLTLSVDEQAVATARQYARSHHTSLSKMVEHLFRGLGDGQGADGGPAPLTAKLLGIGRTRGRDHAVHEDDKTLLMDALQERFL